MAVRSGVPSFVMASRPNVYRACSVDLGWQKTVHSCQRCPRAALTPSAATAAIATQSNVEGTTSRFCPAGVHMGRCVAASEMSTGLWGPASNLNSALGSMLVSKLSKKYTDSSKMTSPGDLTLTDNGLPTWIPPNLPLPSTVHHSKASFSPSLPYSPPLSASPEPVPMPKPKPVTIEPVKIPVRKITSPSELDTEGKKTIHISETAVSDQPENVVFDEPKTPEILVKPTEVMQSPDDRVKITPPVTEVLDSSKSAVVKPSLPDEEKPDAKLPEPEAVDNEILTPTVPSTETIGNLSEKKLNKPSEKSPLSKIVSTFPASTPSSTLGNSSPVVDDSSLKGFVDDAKRSIEATDKENRPDGVVNFTTAVADKKKKEAKLEGIKKPINGELRHPSTTGSTTIPTFFLPFGRSRHSHEELNLEIERARKEIVAAIAALPDDDEKKAAAVASFSLTFDQFNIVTKALGCPLYWKRAIFTTAGGDEFDVPISIDDILKAWRQVQEKCPDDAARFVYLLTSGKSQYLCQDDFRPVIQDVVDTHPSLNFLHTARDFHSRYVTTVVARIFFCVNSSWSGHISLGELRKSNFLSVLASLEEEEDINLVPQYFSYEHFYVIYCKFWDLDEDHDLIISKNDLSRHSNYAISERMIDRIFSGAVTRGPSFKSSTMTYSEFVWFLLAEEDKRHPRSIEYWFRCMDLDGDGVLSLYELEYFYSEQSNRMEEMGIEPPTLEDCLCQCLDMVKPVLVDKIRLSDLKRCNLCSIFFDTFFNLHKYLAHEQRDPFANLRDIEEGLTKMSDWDRYASYTYDQLTASEAGGQDNSATGGGDDEDDEDEEEDEDVSEAEERKTKVATGAAGSADADTSSMDDATPSEENTAKEAEPVATS